jgi:hypothetical protein
LLLRACEREGIPRFYRNEAHSQMGLCEASLTLESQATVYLTGQIISPRKSILLTFFRLKHMPDSIHVRLNRKLQGKRNPS